MADITPEQAQEIWEQYKHIWKPRMDAEEAAVRQLGDRIGYGRLMQVAEAVWRLKNAEIGMPDGAEHTTGPCAAFMVQCPCFEEGAEDQHPEWYSHGHCDWCCGAGRVTKRVAAAMRGETYCKDPT